MTKKTTDNKGSLGPKALEMVMRDVLGGMEEFSIMQSYDVKCAEFKVVSLQPCTRIASNDIDYEQEYLEYLAQELGKEVAASLCYDAEGVINDSEEDLKPAAQLADVIQLDDYLKRKKSDNQ